MASLSLYPLELRIVFNSVRRFATCVLLRSAIRTPLRATSPVGKFDQPLFFFDEPNAYCNFACSADVSEALKAVAADTAFAVRDVGDAAFVTASLSPVDALPAPAEGVRTNSAVTPRPMVP